MVDITKQNISVIHKLFNYLCYCFYRAYIYKCIRVLGLATSLSLPMTPWRIFRLQKTIPDTCVPMLFHEPGVKSGYRLENKSWCYYFCSIFQLHNESVNIWTHLLGSIFIMILTLSYSFDLDPSNPFRAVMLGFGVCCAICITLSACAHTFHSKSQFLHFFCYSMDYAGIGFFTLGASILFFYCSCHHENYRVIGKFYIPINVALSWCGFICSSIAKLRYRRPYPFKRKLWNLCSFGFQTLFSVQFFIYRFLSCWADDDCLIPSLHHHLKTSLLMLMSVFFFSSHFPEKLFPGRFDIVGQGHQIFHALSILQNIEQFRAAYVDIRTFSAITDQIPGASDILVGIVTYATAAVVTLVLLVPFIHKRVMNDQLLEAQIKSKRFD